MLTGSTVLVTGAASGIGAAIALRFARAGARVVAADRNADGLGTVAAQAPGEIEAFVVDVTDADALAEALDDVVARRGGVDHAVCCAGLASRHTIGQMTPAQWRSVVDVNLTGVFLTLQAVAARAPAAGATITAVSSVAARHVAYLSGAHYAASKAALLGLVRHAAFELGRRGIRVNAVAPGPMSNRMGGGRLSSEQATAAARNLPLQRVVEPEDVAEACLFLASPAARAITGAYLPVDGGFLTSRGAPYRGYFDAHGEAF